MWRLDHVPGHVNTAGLFVEMRMILEQQSPLAQETPWCLALIALQFGVDDGAGSAADGQLLPGVHLVLEVRQPTVGINLKLLLQNRGGRRGAMAHHQQ